MKLPRPASSFDSWDEFNEYAEDRADAYDAEAQAADDACSEPDEAE